MAQGNSIWDAAREYAGHGIYVNPVYVTRRPDGKKDVRPVGLWRTASSTSLADIASWEMEHPDAQLLIDCGKSGLVVVDCDGQEGIDNWHALNTGAHPPMWDVETPSGGRHYYYRADPDHPIGNDQDGKVARKVDIRGLGGFVFAPPSSDGSGSWRSRVNPAWSEEARAKGDHPDRYLVPPVVIERMKAVKRGPTSANAFTVNATENDLFDSAAKQFTKAQATDYVKKAKAKLATTTSGYNGAINNFAMACAHFPWLVDRDLCGRLVIKALGPSTGWTEPDSADIATINSAYSATEAGRSWVAEEVEAPASASTERGPESATDDTVPEVLPPPGRPLEVAREIKGWIPASDGQAHRAWWQGDFYRWTGAHWDVDEMPAVEKWLYRMTGDAVFLAPPKKEGEDPVRTPWAPTRKKIGDLAHALGVGELQHEGPEDRALACANGVVTGRELAPHTPQLFNLFSLPFAYDPAAEAPAWRAFLDQVLPGDTEAQDFLGEWFGYVLSGRTEQQKMAALIGKKRSGKGTIARVLGALIGKENVSGLNLGLLSGTFGLEPFVGAALAVASDVRWHSRSIGDAIQVLLEVTGEDHVTVHRKNKQAWKGQLGVRFMLMSNDTPTFSDRSGALVDRMLYVSFKQSFYGREDVGLTDKLMHELPGIFNWALDGLDRLNARGRFTQPASGREEAESTRRLADPIGAFLEDWCDVGPEHSIPLDHLYLKYQNWCEGEGRTKDTTTKEIFSRDLRAKVDGLTSKRRREDGKFMTLLCGVGSSVV